MQSAVENLNLDTSFIKVGILVGIGALFSGFFGWALRSYLGVNDESTIWLVAGALIGFLIVISLQPFFIKSNAVIGGAVLLDTLAMSLNFLDELSLLLLAAFALTAILLYWATKRGHQFLENQLKINFFRVEGAVVKYSITATAIFISLIYINFLEFENSFIPKANFALLFKPAEPILEKYFGAFSFDMTPVQLTEILVVKQLKDQGMLPAGPVKNGLVSELLTRLHDLAGQYGVTFKNNESILDILYRATLDWFQRIPEALRIIVPIGFAALVFFTVKGLGALVRWPISLVAYSVYSLALISGFARIELEPKSKEIIILSTDAKIIK